MAFHSAAPSHILEGAIQRTVMTITITDPGLLAQLKAPRNDIDLCGPDGELIGRLMKPVGLPTAGYVMPISEEELERRRREETDGQTLDEVWRDIFNGHV